LKLESNMKVKKVAVTAAVCAALMGSQASFAEEQPFAAEGMGFAFDDAQVSSVQMSELSGSEMDETEGRFLLTPAIGFGIGVAGYGIGTVASGNDWNWGNAATAGLAGAVAGPFATSPAAAGAIGGGAAIGGAAQGW
jgi:hypothetical protein